MSQQQGMTLGCPICLTVFVSDRHFGKTHQSRRRSHHRRYHLYPTRVSWQTHRDERWHGDCYKDYFVTLRVSMLVLLGEVTDDPRRAPRVNGIFEVRLLESLIVERQPLGVWLTGNQCLNATFRKPKSRVDGSFGQQKNKKRPGTVPKRETKLAKSGNFADLSHLRVKSSCHQPL